MKVNCDYCGSYIETTDEQCPHCGANNTHFVRTASTTPQTIDELLAYCNTNKLPLEKMHVHIGEDYKAPKAFGIYKDEHTGHFVVYKNKADGTRAIRYEGSDEVYAVNEIYTKIKDLVMDAREATVQKKRTNTSSSYRQPTRRKKKPNLVLIITIIVIVIGFIFAIYDSSKDGYYNYDGETYYRHGSYWYLYDDMTDSWASTDSMAGYMDDAEFYGDNYDSPDYNFSFSEFPTEDFSDDWSSSSGDWDSDSDWGGSNDDSWDSSYDSYDFDSGSDWDSDW